MSLKHGVLGILTYSPMTGYNLGKVFNESINYAWTASLSQIYRELNNLEKKGYVSSTIQQQEDRPDKKIYSITEDGKREFEGWLTDFTESFSSPKRDEFTLRIFFGSKVGNTELMEQFKRFIEERESFKEFMTKSKEVVVKFKKALEKDTAQGFFQQDQLYWRFIAKRALMTNEVLIEWAKECIKELEASQL